MNTEGRFAFEVVAICVKMTLVFVTDVSPFLTTFGSEMLSIGNNPFRDCQGMTRRGILKLGASLPIAGVADATLAAAAAKAAPRAKSVMLVWLIGGPSHLDLCDPKPHAPMDYRGPFSAIQTKTPGMQFTELLPKLASMSDKFSVVRTNVNREPGHRSAISVGLTGYLAPDGGEDRGGKPGQYQPHFGSVVSRFKKGSELPGFVSLARGPIGDGVGPSWGYGGGIWGQRYDPFMIDCSPRGEVSVPQLQLLDGITPARLGDRSLIRRELNKVQRDFDFLSAQKLDKDYQQARDLLTSPKTNAAFDLSKESERTRAAYGHSSFGQSALLGRRLVESGVPFVQVNWSQFVEVFYKFSDYGWDTHADNFNLLAEWHGPLLDRVLSTLIQDLDQRGLLDTTLVVCMGEFGRTPHINSIASRDHWHPCYFSLWAGGGVQPGRAIGESDARGEQPLTDPMTPDRVGVTMLDLLGIHAEQRAELGVLQGAELIHELL
ncbi:MAG: DUF1501 domain-containing protein [Pirellulaceae bacterium]|nr:DUF1501 domain-containing protein [Pirellulaceae bacterium]